MHLIGHREFKCGMQDASMGTYKKQIGNSIAQFIADNADALSEAEQKHDQHAQELIKASNKLAHTQLVAPIDGTVQELDVTTIGQVVTAGQRTHDDRSAPRRPGGRGAGRERGHRLREARRHGCHQDRCVSLHALRNDLGRCEKCISQIRRPAGGQAVGRFQQAPVSPTDSAASPTPEKCRGLSFRS